MTDKDPARLAGELYAREQMKELRARYCWYVSRGDYERVLELYTPDGIFEFDMNGTRQSAKGTEGLRAALKATVTPGVVFPLVQNDIIIMKSATEAVGVCSMHARTTVKELPEFGGYYHDTFRVHGGVWRFAKRSYFRYWPQFERSGLDIDGTPETGLSAKR